MKRAPFHRLNDGDDLAIAQSMCQLDEPVEIGRDRTRVDARSVEAAGIPVETFCGSDQARCTYASEGPPRVATN
jgi:hypothetical protein